jgi:hypothetical protein
MYAKLHQNPIILFIIFYLFFYVVNYDPQNDVKWTLKEKNQQLTNH